MLRLVREILFSDEEDDPCYVQLPRSIYQRNDFFSLYDEKSFRRRFRLSKNSVLDLFSEIEHFLIYETDKNDAIPPMCQLLVALRYYATGSFSLTLADCAGMSKSAANRAVHKVSRAICTLKAKYIKFPSTDEEIRSAQQQNCDVCSFPRVLGMLDCTHIPIALPGPLCNSRSDRGQNINEDGTKISFHEFPREVTRRVKWVQAISRQAIIGSGIGGTSCAYFLQQLFEKKATVSLFEKDEVGGRLKLIDIGGYKYEAGGTIIHPRNQYMVEFSKLLGLGIRRPQSSRLGIFDGERFVFEESDWYFFTIAHLLWHYGLSMFYLFKDVGNMMNDFNRIYGLQEKGYSYTSVDLLLNSMNPSFTNLTKFTISDILLEKGYSQKFVDELVQSIMMVNYGQTNNISGFAGFVSLAGAESNLWSVEGGNKLVPEGLIKYSNAIFTKAEVLEVELLPDKKFSVKFQTSPGEPVKTDNFDVVVLSTPLIKGISNIKFVNFKEDFHQFEREYHQTVATFVKGNLAPSAFNVANIPEEILTNNYSLFFNSIGKCSPVDSLKYTDKKSVYKVFSQNPLSKKSIEKLFKDVDIVKEDVWLAYPHYKPPEQFVPFILHPGLYYTNAIELSASAMEMSAIAARNIALLIFNNWKNNMEKIDFHETVFKDEL